MNKIIKFSVKLLISLAFVSWLVLRTDWQEVFLNVQKISLFYIILYVAVLLLGMIISSWKWKMLLAHKNIEVSLKKCFQLYLTGAFINNFMPSTIGGDTYRAYQIGKKHEKMNVVSSSVVFDRLSGLFALMILMSIVTIFQWSEIAKHFELKLSVLAVLALMITIVVFAIFVRFDFWKKVSSKFPDFIQEFGRELNDFRNGNTYLKALGVSILFGLIGLALVNGILFIGLGIQIPIMKYLSVIFLVSIISSLPISINNIGIKEWAYITFFGFFGISSSAVVTVALLSRALQMIVSFTALPMYLNSKKKN